MVFYLTCVIVFHNFKTMNNLQNLEILATFIGLHQIMAENCF
jgi:hypothetical protein